MNVTIYALVDPTTERVKYVGQAINPAARLIQHIRRQGDANPRMGLWTLGLLEQGLQPRMDVLEIVGDDLVDQREKVHIQRMIDAGEKLFNVSDGGKTRSHTKAAHLSRDEWLEMGNEFKRAAERIRMLRALMSDRLGKKGYEAIDLVVKQMEKSRRVLHEEVSKHRKGWPDAQNVFEGPEL